MVQMEDELSATPASSLFVFIMEMNLLYHNIFVRLIKFLFYFWAKAYSLF